LRGVIADAGARRRFDDDARFEESQNQDFRRRHRTTMIFHLATRLGANFFDENLYHT
jgi:hypothetical protein